MRRREIAAVVAVAWGAFAIGWLLNPPGAAVRAQGGEPPGVQPPSSTMTAAAVGGDAPLAAGAETRPAPTRPATPTVQLTPGAPGYDGEAAATWLDLTPAQLFEREPRDPAWASAMEESVGRLLAERAQATGLERVVVGGECHTSTCRTTIEVSARDKTDALTYLSAGLAPLGSTRSYDVVGTTDGQVEVELTYIFAARIRAVDDYQRWFAGKQVALADELRAWRERWLARREGP